ncbi:uncharacterized protein LOC143621299 [Bidens hawaiensis]|uniref:uncharacterized protein LOC143621299 n=1 Tax=Bidens hawaiensis TaxID=980011 RepID=UPI004049F848
MASPSELLSKWRENQSFNQTIYRTKKIYFSRNSTRIVLQNENGPCPLIAICNPLNLLYTFLGFHNCNIMLLRGNIMLLRGTYNLKDQTHVSEAQLLTFVAESLFNSLCKEENNVTTVADAIGLMANLTTGMLVDVKFQRIDGFEFTRENEVFGLLDMRLVHGWLVDPQDAETANAIGSKSYNTLMGELVAHQINNSLGSEAVSVKSSEEDKVEVEHFEKEDIDPVSENSDSVIREPTSNVVESSKEMKETIDESSSSTTANLDGVISELTLNIVESSIKVKETIAESSSLTTNGTDGVISEPTSNVVESSEKMKEPIAESSSSATVNSDSVISEPTSNVVESLKKMKEAIAESSSSASTSNVNEGIKSFLILCTTKMCPFDFKKLIKVLDLFSSFRGTIACRLRCLQEGLEEQKLCVFFRNNHFNTMFRYIGELYILVTDEGYMDQPGVVWEKLTEVTGDTVFVNSYFMDFKPVNHEIEENTRIQFEECQEKGCGDCVERVSSMLFIFMKLTLKKCR